MPIQKIGITAMELFACNPYRILGVAVNTKNSEVKKAYEKLLDMASKDNISAYNTPFDFPSLPPYPRTISSIETAYTKLTSNGYRCFAYADGQFTAALNIDDVALNLRDISCYDCFLRCYMWLVVNDRTMEETQLWIQLAEYIDMLISSTSDKWKNLFDNRYPKEMIDNNQNILKSFHTTFCEIILLPIKEMVRGSMKCVTATEILKMKGIDFDEVFPFIEIPQANIEKNGEPVSKLKLALKDGDEYFDIATGKMVYFASDNSAKVESHEFEEASTPISADVLISETDDNITNQNINAEIIHSDVPVENSTNVHKKIDNDFGNISKSSHKKKNKLIETQNKPAPKLMIKKDHTTLFGLEKSTESNLTEKHIAEEIEKIEANQYTNALIEMLRANRNKNQFMKDVDTTHIIKHEKPEALQSSIDITMDDINMKIYDSALLSSPYEINNASSQNTSLEEKYKNIKIDSTFSNKFSPKFASNFERDPISEFINKKAKEKASLKFLLKTTLFITLCCLGYIILKLVDII